MRFICENCGKEAKEGGEVVDLERRETLPVTLNLGGDAGFPSTFLLCSDECRKEFQVKLVEYAASLTDGAVVA